MVLLLEGISVYGELYVPPRSADRGRQNGIVAMIQPRLPVIAMKIGSGKPVVGATLVVVRSRRRPVFIPLCDLRKAMVIPRCARNLKSMITRPVSQCHAYIVTNSENSVRTLQVGFTLRPTF